MAPVCTLSCSWVIFLSQSRTNVMCHFTSLTPSKNVIELSVIILSSSILVSQCCQVMCRVVYCSRESCNPMSTSAILSTFVSVCAQLFHQTNLLLPVSCRRCGIYRGPPSTDLFLSTSDHYLGVKYRDHPST